MRYSKPSTIKLDLEREADTAAERLALWRNALEVTGIVKFPDQINFTGTFASRTFDDIIVAHVHSNTFQFLRDKSWTRNIERDYVIINYVEQGGIKGQIAGRKVLLKSGDLLFSRLAVSMDIVLENAEWRGLLVPRATFEKSMPWRSSLDGKVFAQETAQARILGGLMRSLGGLPDPLPSKEAVCAARSCLSLLVTCLDGQLQRGGVVAGKNEDPAASIRRFISAHLANPRLGVDAICSEFNVSRSKLYRLMGENSDISGVIRRMRLHAVHEEITNGGVSEKPLAEIGKRWGLQDERSYRRAFVKEFGYPPSALRTKVRNATHVGLSRPGGIGAELGRWFKGL